MTCPLIFKLFLYDLVTGLARLEINLLTYPTRGYRTLARLTFTRTSQMKNLTTSLKAVAFCIMAGAPSLDL